MLEIEVKIKVNLKETELKLESFGFLKGTSVYEKDTYFNGKLQDLKKADKALRIREHKDLDTGHIKYVLNYKGPKLDDITMTREESQFEVPSFEVGKTVLNGLGYFEAGGVEKHRIHYKKDGITCCLDTVTNLGEFLEIEIMSGKEDYDASIGRIRSLLGDLGLDMSMTIRHSYLSMLENAKITIKA